MLAFLFQLILQKPPPILSFHFFYLFFFHCFDLCFFQYVSLHSILVLLCYCLVLCFLIRFSIWVSLLLITSSLKTSLDLFSSLSFPLHFCSVSSVSVLAFSFHYPFQVPLFTTWVGFRSSKYQVKMLDPSDKGSDSEDQNKKYPERISSKETQNQSNDAKKTCADCGTSKTPLWRGGPAGPKSLCNACGIRSRKKRRAILGINKGEDNNKKSKKGGNNSNSNGSSSTVAKNNLGDNLKQRFLSLGREVLMQRRKLGEEEQAAVLLMALSYGSVYA